MRRSGREITARDELDAIIHSSLVCRLAFADQNEPYLVPVSFGYDGTAVYFHTASSGRKLEFIARNNRVCFELERDLRLETEAGQLILSGKAADEISPIASLEYSLDGEGWRTALPMDGMLDSRSESFRLAVPRVDAGRQPSVVGVRVADAVGHLATAQLRVPIIE